MRTYRNLLVGLSFVLLSTLAMADPASSWTPAMQQWMTYYYLDPRPERAVEYLTPLNDALKQSKGRSLADEVNRGGMRAFYAQVFKRSDQAVRDLEAAWPRLPEDIRQFAREALRRCHSAECRRVLGEDVLGTERLPSMREVRTSDLDDAWGKFMATGDFVHVEYVASVLPLIDARGHPERMAVAAAAKWSLTSNAAQHQRVLDMCRRLAIAESSADKAAMLREIIADAESARSRHAPDEPDGG